MVAHQFSEIDASGFTGGVPVVPEPRPIWTNAVDTYQPEMRNDYGAALKTTGKTASGIKVTIWRWRKEIQNDFAARMDWTTKPYAAANHPPLAFIKRRSKSTMRPISTPCT